MPLPSTVQAITIAKTGGIEVIEKTAEPFPKVQSDHIVIKVEYLGVNFIDTYFRQGLYPLKGFPAILGMEAAGSIVALPEDQTALNDPAFKRLGFAIGGKVAVDDQLGTFATYISVPWQSVFPVPSSVSTLTAAAALLQSMTAVTFSEEAYHVQKGDSILIHTVAGGLGMILTQLAKHRGAIVIGTTSTQEKAELAKTNGADHVILYPIEDTVKRVLEITKGEGVHAIFDGVGKTTFDNNFKMIRRKGTLVSIGNASGVIPPFSPLKLGEKNVKLLRPVMSHYAETVDEKYYYGTQVFSLISGGVIKIKIFKEYPFTAEGVQQAHEDLTGGNTAGKLVIKVSDD